MTSCHMPLAFVMALTTTPSFGNLEQGEDLANVCEKFRLTVLPAPSDLYYEEVECDSHIWSGFSSSDEKSPTKVARTWKKLKALAFWSTRRGSQTSASSCGSRESGKVGPKSAPSSTAGSDNACCDDQSRGVQEHACLSGSIPTGRRFSSDGLRPSTHGELQHIFLTDAHSVIGSNLHGQRRFSAHYDTLTGSNLHGQRRFSAHCDPVTGSNLHGQRRFSVSCGSLPKRHNHSGCRASLRAHPGRQDVSAASHPHVGGRSVLPSHPRRSCDNVSTVHESPGTHGFPISSRNRRHTSKDSNCFSSASPVNARRSQTRFSVSCSSLHDHQHNHSHRHNSSRSSTSIHQGNQNVHVSSHSKERSKLFEAVTLPPAHLRRASLPPTPLHSPQVDQCIKVTSSSHTINPRKSLPEKLPHLLKVAQLSGNVFSGDVSALGMVKNPLYTRDSTYSTFSASNVKISTQLSGNMFSGDVSTLGMVENPLYTHDSMYSTFSASNVKIHV